MVETAREGWVRRGEEGEEGRARGEEKVRKRREVTCSIAWEHSERGDYSG